MKTRLPSLRVAAIAISAALLSTSPLAADDKEKADASIFASMKWRSLGPAVTGGRISDFAVNPQNPAHYYAATASAGLWKTVNSGTTWEPVFDGEASYSIGDIAMDPHNPNVLWVGTGENNSQRSVAYGDGVYKSLDGGGSWKNVGLKNSEHIGKILIDPRDSNVVYVAAQGPLWSKGGDRGVYKTIDGGENWEKVLEISEHTGASDMVFDPANPDIIYATSYQRRRHVWTLLNGGPESSIYKSVDAGKTWQKIDKGLPKVDLGRIGITIAPSAHNTLYAIVEAAEGKSGFYRSTNGGASWHKQSDYISSSPQYYQEIVADPKNPDRVYSLDTFMMVSDDGGKNFRRAGTDNRHVDDHALWIDPSNTDHLRVGSDGGIYESWDKGKNWHFKDNMPLTQFYRVSVDNDFPFYNVFGGTQDNASLGAPHRTMHTSGIRNSDWIYTQFGDGFKTQIDPSDPNIIYSQYQYGGLARYDKRSGERMQIKPVSPDANEAQRFNWNSPLLISPHNNERLYYASQRVFQSDDRGESWKPVSGDLSRDLDRNTLKVMDKVWSVDAVAKNKSTSFYGSVIALTESTLKEGLLYAGTDDGLIQLTQDGGNVWTHARWPKKVPEYSYVSDLEASLFDDKTLFATFDNHKKGDFKPYVYKSTDNGKKWVNITGDLPERGTVYTIVQDHVDKDLLFVGTEFGVFFTQNGGKNWVQLKSGIPTITIRDMEIQRRESDLALASFGRGFYVLDDYSALRSDAKTVKDAPATLFPVRRTFQYIEYSPLGLPGKSMQGADYYIAENPEYGAAISYYVSDDFTSLKDQRRKAEKDLVKDGKDVSYPSWDALKEEDLEPKAELIFTIRDNAGNLVRRLRHSAAKGYGRIYWDLRYPGFETVTASDDDNVGPFVAPGTYQVSLSKRVNGVETDYGQRQSVQVVSIDNRTFPSTDRAADLAFDMQAGRLAKAINGAVAYVGELDGRLNNIDKAITMTAGVDQGLLAQVATLERRLAETKMRLQGNSVVAKRSEPTPTSVTGYIGYLQWSRGENTGPVTPDQRLRFSRASEGYSSVYDELMQISAGVDAMEKALTDADSIWLPGTAPLKGI